MLSEDIAKYLSSKSIGVYDEVGTTGDIYIMNLPTSPDDVIAIYPTGGTGSDMKLGYDTPTIQILVRGAAGDPVPTSDRAQSIYNALQGLGTGEIVPGGTFIISCQGIQSAPTYINQDEQGRHEWTMNFIVEIRNKTVNRE